MHTRLQEWVIENATRPQNNVNTEISEIEQLNDGTVKIRFHEPSDMLLENRSMSSRISREIYEWNIDGYTDRQIKFKGGGVQPINTDNSFQLGSISKIIGTFNYITLDWQSL